VFESLVGIRYLVNTRRSYALQLFSLIGIHLLLNGAGITFFMKEFGRLGLLGLLMLIVGSLLSYVCILAMVLSVYTVISVVGVTLGVAALTTVLSVMSGFEEDLQSKILGANAHIVVRKEGGGDLEHWQAMMDLVRDTPGIVGISPYIEDEVISTSTTGLAGAVIKGIDADTISEVSDLSLYLTQGQGSLAHLIDPDKLAEDFPVLSFPYFPPPETEPTSNQSMPAINPSHVFPEDHLSPKGPRYLDEDFPDPFRPRRPPRLPLNIDDLPLELPSGPGQVIEVPFAPPPLPTPRRLPGVLIGKQLAEKTLHVSIGDEINIVTPWGELSPKGPLPKSRPFRVAGIFYSGMYELDAKNAYMLLSEAQRFLSLDDTVTGFEIRVYQIDKAAEIAAKIQAKLTGLPGGPYEAIAWQELNRSLFSALKVEKQMMFLVLVIIILVAAFFIVSSLLMVVIQKRKELSVLMSMGATRQMILRIFLAAGAFIGVTGTTFGILGGYSLCKVIQWRGVPIPTDVYYISNLPVLIDPLEFFIVGSAALLISLLATLYPSRLASGLRPIEGLKL
jgi:lipoprotein-releasing system permease protein